MQPFHERAAIVTGAGSGVGKAIALKLADLGATVYLIGRRQGALQEVAREIGIGGGHAECLSVDITDDQALREAACRVQIEAGRADVLIHSAGIIALGLIQNAPVDDLDDQYQTNVRGPFMLTKALLPLLKRERGQIVFINSSTGLSAQAGNGQYAATKHALKAIADSLRCEVNEDGVRVLSVFLGRTATPMQQKLHRIEGKGYHPEYLIQPEDVAGTVIHALLQPTTVEITDITLRPMRKPM